MLLILFSRACITKTFYNKSDSITLNNQDVHGYGRMRKARGYSYDGLLISVALCNVLGGGEARWVDLGKANNDSAHFAAQHKLQGCRIEYLHYFLSALL